MTICDDARQKGLEMTNAQYDPFISDVARIVQNMLNKGLDPTKYYDAKNDAIINMAQMLADLTEKKEQQVKSVNEKVDAECQNAVDFLQKLTDFAVAAYTAGLSEVLPKHMTHIDIGEIISGHPFGGDNSIFNQLRDQILWNGLGLGENNDLRKIIENPIATTKDGVNDFFERNNIPIRL